MILRKHIALICSGQYVAFSMAGQVDLTALKCVIIVYALISEYPL